MIHEGTFELGAQEHFYLETLGCLVIPKRESDEIEIISTTQDPSGTQETVSKILGIPRNRIVSKCKRLGGGFGGKETRINSINLPCVIAARKLNKPIRCILDRNIDMMITGKRHPFRGDYKCRVSRDGMFKACEMTLINNGGHSMDMSAEVLIRAMKHADNVYNFPNFRVSGRIAKTNVASNTA